MLDFYEYMLLRFATLYLFDEFIFVCYFLNISKFIIIMFVLNYNKVMFNYNIIDIMSYLSYNKFRIIKFLFLIHKKIKYSDFEVKLIF
jgi:hypothetical protein